MSAREFGEAWALSQLSPGIHLVALAGLIGRRVAGWRGVVAAVAGMMIRAGTIAVALSAAYGVIAASPIARAALAGQAPLAQKTPTPLNPLAAPPATRASSTPR